MKTKTFSVFLLFFCLLILSLALRGLPGNPGDNDLNTVAWTENGPFELSPERGRIALLYSVVEDRSLELSSRLADFARPDVGLVHGKYVSLFPPAVSFLAIPGYLLGRALGYSMVGAGVVVAVFALANFFLVKALAEKMGADAIPAALGALAFLFGTPAFAYGVSFYQHHLSFFFIFLAVFLFWEDAGHITRLMLWFCLGMAVIVDYPNIFLVLPLILQSFWQAVVIERKYKKIVALPVFFLPVLFLLFFNQLSYGHAFRLSGTVPRSTAGLETLSAEDKLAYSHYEAEDKAAKTVVAFFNSRDLLNGFLVHLISPDRGVVFYAPAVLIGILGAVIAYRKNLRGTILLINLASLNLVIYSLWGDPWGGWAFGSRYLIPAYGVLAVFLSLFLTYCRPKALILPVFLVILGYSLAVNTLGALTSSKNPPRVEILALEKMTNKEEKYTFARNFDYLAQKGVKALAGRFLPLLPGYYYLFVLGLLLWVSVGFSLWYFLAERRRHDL